MKTSILLALSVLLGFHAIGASELPASRYEIGERGPNHRVWNKVTTATNTAGQVSLATNLAYVELGSGLHYAENGQWQETKEEFTVVPGWALARKGPHKVGLAYNLNAAGAVAVEMPDGRTVRSTVLSLHYIDKSTGRNVRLAEITNCAGVVLPPNQVIYTNAFSGITADIRYTYTKSGIEQDVILRRRPPRPEDFGLSAATTRLVVLTEFMNPPAAAVKSRTVDNDQIDEEIGFGPMLIGRGQAFGLATNSSAQVPRSALSVRKRWLQVNGRYFLMEQVPLPDANAELDTLPEQTSITPRRTKTLLAGLDVPASRPAPSSAQPMEIAQVWPESPGFVMDYIQLNASLTNFSFQSNMTYLASGRIDLHGLTTFEGGSVIKCASVPGVLLSIAGWSESTWFKSTPYSPIIFTSVDDDSVGASIAASTGNPSVASTNNIYLSMWEQANIDVHDVRMSYADISLMLWNGTSGQLSNIQSLHSHNSFWIGDPISLRNVLVHDVSGAAFLLERPVRIEHLTVDHCTTFALGPTNAAIAITNSLLSDIQWIGNVPLTTNSVAFADTNSTVFQSYGLGQHYLAASSPYRDIGTANINATLLTNLQQMTTYPPPDSYLDANTLDLGFHYPVMMDWDADGVEDNWELANFGSLDQNGSGDFDGDGLTDAEEYKYGWNPANSDQNSNGVLDGQDDWDGDLLSNETELHKYFTNPVLAYSNSGQTVHDAVYKLSTREVQTGEPSPTQMRLEFASAGGGTYTTTLSDAIPGRIYEFLVRYVPASGPWTHYQVWFRTNAPATGIISRTIPSTPPTGYIGQLDVSGLGEDTDGDGLSDVYEVEVTHTLPDVADTDHDGINDGNEDPDGDGLLNVAEYHFGTNPNAADSVADTDHDGLTDTQEGFWGTDPATAPTWQVWVGAPKQQSNLP